MSTSVEDQWDAEFDRWTPRRVKVWLAIIVAVCLFGGIGIWGFNVVTSGAKGRGDQIVQNNSNVNRTGKQEMFEDLYADIQGYKVQIGNAAADVTANTDPSDAGRLKSVLTGLKNQCTSTVQQYNAETHKVLSEDWKDARLPYQLNPDDFCSGKA